MAFVVVVRIYCRGLVRVIDDLLVVPVRGYDAQMVAAAELGTTGHQRQRKGSRKIGESPPGLSVSPKRPKE